MKDYSVLDNMIRMVGDAIKQAFDKVYKQGYEDGIGDGAKSVKSWDKACYEQGLNDAWEAARKLIHPRYGGYYDDTKLEIFDYRNSDDVLTMLSASEVIAKIKEYEEKQTKKSCHNCGKTSCGVRKAEPDIACLNWVAKQTDDEIRVGDEVYIKTDGCKGIVWGIEFVEYLVFGGTSTMYYGEHLEKTGRHFDAIEEVLEQMRENDND